MSWPDSDIACRVCYAAAMLYARATVRPDKPATGHLCSIEQISCYTSPSLLGFCRILKDPSERELEPCASQACCSTAHTSFPWLLPGCPQPLQPFPGTTDTHTHTHIFSASLFSTLTRPTIIPARLLSPWSASGKPTPRQPRQCLAPHHQPLPLLPRLLCFPMTQSPCLPSQVAVPLVSKRKANPKAAKAASAPASPAPAAAAASPAAAASTPIGRKVKLTRAQKRAQPDEPPEPVVPSGTPGTPVNKKRDSSLLKRAKLVS